MSNSIRDTLRRRLIRRLTRAMYWWGLLKHSYGREYAVRRFTPLGGWCETIDGDDDTRDQ